MLEEGNGGNQKASKQANKQKQFSIMSPVTCLREQSTRISSQNRIDAWRKQVKIINGCLVVSSLRYN